MLGDRDIRSTIENSIDTVANHLDYQIDKSDLKKIHASEATGCLRRAYFNRTDPLPTPRSRFADLLGGMFRNLEYGSKSAQFSLDDLTLEGQADMVVDDLIMLFKSVKKFPDDPFAKDILYVNACMWIYDKIDGIIIYIDGNGKEVSFSVTRNKKMFEEVVRRVRVLVDLLKEKKIPILEPSIECSTCQYYERCFTQRKESKTINLMNLLGKSKDRSDMIDEI
tara:strand:+ start:275 stop:943 length:669 start_codon:yes stop_codon:yes gene_type:complete